MTQKLSQEEKARRYDEICQLVKDKSGINSTKSDDEDLIYGVRSMVSRPSWPPEKWRVNDILYFDCWLHNGIIHLLNPLRKDFHKITARAIIQGFHNYPAVKIGYVADSSCALFSEVIINEDLAERINLRTEP